MQHEQQVTGTPKYVVYIHKVDNLRRVTFGPSSSLEWIGIEAFGAYVDWDHGWGTCGLVEISIPDSVRELCDDCFKGYSSLRRVTFGPSSSLERIGVSCFEATGVEEVCVPDGVRELCDGCFEGCSRLRRVTFAPSSSLERIGAFCFRDTGVEEVSVPDGVRELCEGCFEGCSRLRVLPRRLSGSGRGASTKAVLSSSRSLLLCERLVRERLANAH